MLITAHIDTNTPPSCASCRTSAPLTLAGLGGPDIDSLTRNAFITASALTVVSIGALAFLGYRAARSRRSLSGARRRRRR